MTQNNSTNPLFSFSSCHDSHGIDRANLDPSVRPGDDFYSFACGGWMKNNPLLPEYSRFGTFDKLREDARQKMKDLVTGLKNDPATRVAGTIAQKISDLYDMGMDASRLDREGATPLLPMLEKIRNVDPKDIASVLAWLHNGITSSFFSTGVGPGYEDSSLNIMHVGEMGLGLGDRDYYLQHNETNDRIMDEYDRFIRRIMQLAGYSEEDARRVSDNVVRLETRFAEAKMTREQRRNPALRSNITSLAELKQKYSGFDWDTYFSALDLPDFDKVNVSSPGFLKFLSNELPTISATEIRDYLAYDLVSESTSLLSGDFFDAAFQLYDRVMSGTPEPEPRWKRAMAIPVSILGEAVGELYVQKYFPPESKEYMIHLVENLRGALARHIHELSWMSPATKNKALEKLNAMTVKIGYPDKWKDYSGITVDPSLSYLENVRNASAWYVRDNYSKLGKPVDRSEWHMTPQTVNAYYNPAANEICFPAGILQPPYFDPSADDAMNYGAIGVVIGHEMTHAFDDQGRQYDADGNLNDWWLPEDSRKFSLLADKLVDQFDQVVVSPETGVHANGRYTLGENIADQGGLRIALTAYLDSRQDKETDADDGFSSIQRFYLAYAGVWAGNIREEEILQRTKTDPHSLGRLRVNVTLRNLEPFFDAFSIVEGDPMYRPPLDRVIIW